MLFWNVFDDYWGEPAHIKDITLKVIADADSIVMNLEGGAVDMIARVSTAQAAELSDKFEILEGTMNLVQAVYLNNTKAPLIMNLCAKHSAMQQTSRKLWISFRKARERP